MLSEEMDQAVRNIQLLDDDINRRLMTWERKIMREIYGPTKENGQWRIKTNAELMTKYKAPDTVNAIKIGRL
jgi:hypothetical protein